MLEETNQVVVRSVRAVLHVVPVSAEVGTALKGSSRSEDGRGGEEKSRSKLHGGRDILKRGGLVGVWLRSEGMVGYGMKAGM